eukprot:COSAG02_NODE_4271_length_5563_cov_3.829063_6_plen_159_part_00
MYTIYGCDRVSFGPVAYMDSVCSCGPDCLSVCECCVVMCVLVLTDFTDAHLNQSDSKAKEPPAPQIDLEFRMIGVDGRHIGRKEFRASHFRTLDVCNVPRRGQTTACPNPSDRALELIGRPRDSGKKKKGSTQVRHLLCYRAFRLPTLMQRLSACRWT